MNPFREVTLGEEIFSEIESNEYLNELYENILHNYSQRLFQLPNICDAEVDIDHALRFADLLSKSVGTRNSDKHKIWAQEIVALLHYIYPEDARITYYMGSVLSNTSNYRGMSMITPDFKETTLFDRLYSEFNMDYLTIPADPEYRFFPSQKAVYDNFDRQYFSYSAPTSMGKSFMMRMFIKEQVMDGKKHNYAIIVPTKALINEVSSKIIQDLKGMLQKYDYRVVTSSGDIALTTPHNYIFVLTPERLLYLLISDKNLRLDYLFIDEAHKISSKDKRSAFYYKVVDMLSRRKPSPHIIFASPNIPNPEVFLELIPNAEIAMDDRLASSYAPVSQMKYMVDFVERQARYYNPITKSFSFLAKLKDTANLQNVVYHVGKGAQNIVYCSSKNNAVQFARDYAKLHNPRNIPELDALAKDIRNEVHTEYYLADLVEKGVAYHIGYLPADISVDSNAKSLNEILLARMLNVSGRIAYTEEFQKAGIVPKTIRVQYDGSIRESMSFPTFDFFELSNEDELEESDLYNYLAPTKFMFVIFQQRADGEYVFERVMFWNIPNEDLEQVRLVWERTVTTIREGVKLVPTAKGISNNLPKKTENPVAHVRPHGKDASDKLPLPDGRWMTKQCFWLNNTYIRKQIESRK